VCPGLGCRAMHAGEGSGESEKVPLPGSEGGEYGAQAEGGKQSASPWCLLVLVQCWRDLLNPRLRQRIGIVSGPRETLALAQR